jgi:hypothetical protein
MAELDPDVFPVTTPERLRMVSLWELPAQKNESRFLNFADRKSLSGEGGN